MFHEAATRLAQPVEVELKLGDSKPIKVHRRAQLDMSPLTVYVTETSDLADENAGGYAIATAFAGVNQRSVALRWTAAWRRAERGEQPDLMRLAPRDQEDIRGLLEQMEARLKYDLDYLRNWSPLLDLKILFKTMLIVARGDKAY